MLSVGQSSGLDSGRVALALQPPRTRGGRRVSRPQGFRRR